MPPPPTATNDHGCLPPWKQAELPAPLPFSFGNVLRTIGPGAILLAASIGGGEWIVGPMMAVQYGPSILWVATAAIILQSLFNLEAVRYTLYTGEPIFTGFMRLSPGPKLWATFYLAIGCAQLATPALAAGCAGVLMAAWLGKTPGAEHASEIHWIAIGVILLTVALLQSGKSIERVLERLSWIMVILIFVFLILVNVLFVPWNIWRATLGGFFVVRPLPENVDLVMLALFAATAGSGGLGNLTISNWFRDKGFGMGSYMGGIGSSLRKGHLELQTIGRVFPVTPENLSRWRTWWRYCLLDQSALWAVGCFFGMMLNVNLVLAIIPHGMQFEGYGAGTYQARFLAEAYWSGFWFLALLNGFWILYSTHLGNVDCLVRTVVDILWSASPRNHRWGASKLYTAILGALTVWALISIHFGSVLDLFKVLGVVANPIMAIAAVQILRVNTRFLPPELRPSWWRRLALVLCAVCYGSITVMLLWQQLQRWMS